MAMARAIDMTGRTFGNLRVIERASLAPASRAAYWRCACECGEEITVRGSDLRKGDRKSCGCLNPRQRPRRQSGRAEETSDALNQEARVESPSRRQVSPSGWNLKEFDGHTFMVSNAREEVIVELGPTGWACSEHGAFVIAPPGHKGGAIITCEHIAAATRDMPMDKALELAALLIPRRAPVGRAKEDKPTQEAEEARAAIARAEANASRGRHLARDEEHARVTSEVVTRTITDEDRQRLAERKRAKRIFVEEHAGRPL